MCPGCPVWKGKYRPTDRAKQQTFTVVKNNVVKNENVAKNNVVKNNVTCNKSPTEIHRTQPRMNSTERVL